MTRQFILINGRTVVFLICFRESYGLDFFPLSWTVKVNLVWPVLLKKTTALFKIKIITPNILFIPTFINEIPEEQFLYTKLGLLKQNKNMAKFYASLNFPVCCCIEEFSLSLAYLRRAIFVQHVPAGPR